MAGNENRNATETTQNRKKMENKIENSKQNSINDVIMRPGTTAPF